MNTTFINSKNSKTSNPHRLLLSLADEVDFRRKEKYFVLPNLSI